jgi:hypothetical protein
MQQYYGTLVTLRGGLHTGGIGQWKETKDLNVVDVVSA